MTEPYDPADGVSGQPYAAPAGEFPPWGFELNARSFTIKDLPDGRRIDVTPMTFGKGRLHVAPSFDALWYDDEWCYEHYGQAVAAALAWDGEGEPEGWMRHPDSGRRRPNGDPAAEYVHL